MKAGFLLALLLSGLPSTRAASAKGDVPTSPVDETNATASANFTRHMPGEARAFLVVLWGVRALLD